MGALEDTFTAIVRRANDKLRAEIKADASVELAALADALSPRLLDRAGLAKMFGITMANLRTILFRGRKGESEFGAALVELTREIGGKEVWIPSEIALHCVRRRSGVDATIIDVEAE